MYPMPLKHKLFIIGFGILTIFMVALAIVGAFRLYSPVPFWDMWDGYLGFFMRVTDGEYEAWWALHNEHRIVLARLLFWADIKWFGGASWFLIVANYLLVSASVLVFWQILRESAATKTPSTGEIFLGLLLTIWIFLWSQEENFTWAFQSQFILAQLLPLCALYWLHKSVTNPASQHDFVVACCFGLASVGTMANGILALPLMTFYSLLTKQRAVRISVLASLSVATFFIYFDGYITPAKHGTLTQALKENPSGLIKYTLLYLGNPFYFILGQRTIAKYIAGFLGLMLAFTSIWLAIKSLRNCQEKSLQLAMLFFILYVGGTAFGTAGGRLIFGVIQATSSRYTTPALMAWAALLIIFSPDILAMVKKRGVRTLLPFSLLTALTIPLQLHALLPRDNFLFSKKIAALALELGVEDEKQVGLIYHTIPQVSSFAKTASAKNLSIFGIYPYIDLKEQLGNAAQQIEKPACQGHLDTVETIPGDDRFVLIKGWVMNSTDKTYPELIRFLDQQGKIMGFALTGEPRPDISQIIGSPAPLAGYQGYLLTGQTGTEFTLQGDTSCQMQVKPDMPPYTN